MGEEKNMRRLTVVFAVLLVALALVAAPPVVAQPPNYDSAINIRNMENDVANVEIQFFAPDGTRNPAADVSLQIPALSMAHTFVLNNTQLPANFQGSAVVASDNQLAIIHNLRINVGEQGASTSGFGAGAPIVRMPLIMRNNGGYTTWFSVQNAGSQEAVVEVDFFAGTVAGNNWKWVNPTPGAGLTPNQVRLAPGQAYYFDQAVMPALGTRFIGSAVATSVNGQPLVGSVVQVGPFGLFAYDGFGSAGSSSLLVPLFHYRNAGFQSSVQVQNVGTAPTTVTMTYTPSLAGNACTETRTVAPGASEIFGFLAFHGPTAGSNCWDVNSSGGVGTRFVGSAHVSANTDNQPLLGVVNQMNSTTLRSGSYNAYAPDAATQCVIAPIIMDNNAGYWTGISLMNVGATATTVTIQYSPFEGHTPASGSVTLQPNQGASVLHWGQLRATPTARYIGSAQACGDAGALIVAVVNQLNDRPGVTGDTLYVYNAFNISPQP